MKKFLIILFVVICYSSTSFAQRVFDYKDRTEALSVFSDKDIEINRAGGAQAGLTISCPSNLTLRFESNVDKTVDVYNTDQRGGVNFYYLRFIVGRFQGANYSGRVLEVICDGYLPLKIKVDLQASESKWYEIFDPNATVGVGCFYENFNAGAELYRKAMYAEALEKYKLAKECTDYQESSNINYLIESIDSIFALRTKGDNLFNNSNYRGAYDTYQKIVGYNSSDQYARDRSREALAMFTESCITNFQSAENYYYEGNYVEAKKMYEIVVAQSCSNSREANLKLAEVTKRIVDRGQKATVVLYEIAENTPIGLSYGRYTTLNFSAYVSMRLNPELFSAISKSHNINDKAEVNFSFGWNRMIIQQAGLFFGVGYTGVGQWNYGENGEYADDPKFTLHNAVSPEAGVLIKLGPIALKYTFQYRYSLKSDMQDYIGKMRHVGGIGICF